MPLDLKRGIVRILSADGATTSGTGFLLSEKGIIVTCSHVIQAEKLQVRGYPRPERVEIVFRANGQKAAARLLPQAWRPADGEDVAFLQLEGPLPQDVEALPLGSSDGAAGHQFQSFGFPDQSPEEGLYGEGQLIEQTSILGMKVWQVKSSEVTPGFSGGPVFDEQARRVVGMVTSIAAPDKFGRLSETAFITPAETLFSILPEIAASDVRPYMGLAAFTEKDAEFFFGRKKLVEGLEESLRARPRFLLVMGPSGSGKSSVVQAGLIPRLKKGSVPGSDRWGIIVARPADRPFESLERAGLRGAYAGLAEAVRGWMERNPGQERLLLILDQFEEFLVTCPSDLRQQLWIGLKSLLDTDFEVTVMAVMRDDFYSHLASDAPPAVLAWTQHGFFQVGSLLEKEELEEIISEPARRVGLRLEEGLADVIINDVLESSQEGGGKAGRSTVLPLLEFALTQLWERREQGVLTHQAYQAAGRVTGSLTAWADQVCRALEKEGLGPVARRAFTDLVNLGDGTHPDSRRQRRLAELVHDGKDENELEAVRKVVRRLADARLVTTSLDKGEESVQIIHDSLIREWARLQQWLRKDRAFLSWKREMEWDSREWRDTAPEVVGRDEGRLLRGLKLEEAERWLGERERDLGEGERGFIKASLGLRQREQEREEKARADKERTRKRIIQGIVVFSIFSLALAGLAYDQMLEANDRKEEALARSLASQSEQMRGVTGSLTESALLAVESLRHKETLEGSIALRRSLALMPKYLFVLNNSFGDVDISANGILATASRDNTSRLWDVQAGKELHRLEHDGQVNELAFNSEGSKLATASQDNTSRLWNVQTGKELYRLEHDSPVNKVAFSLDGSRLATAGSDNAIRIWDVQTGKELKRLVFRTWLIKLMAFSSDKSKIAITTEDSSSAFDVYKTAHILNAQTGEELRRFQGFNFVDFSRDEQKMVVAYDNGTIQLWDIQTGNELQGLEIEDLMLVKDFSPDGTKLAIASSSNAVQILDVKSGKELMRMEHDYQVSNVAFSSDGGMVASTSIYDKTVRIWDVQTGKESRRLEHSEFVHEVFFSPDGKLITWSYDNIFRLWDVISGKAPQRLEQDGSVIEVALNMDGSKLATTLSDNTIRLWDVHAGKELHKLDHDGQVHKVVFSPDGIKLATASEDNTSRLWDIQTGKEIQRMEHGGPVYDVAFNSDGYKLATASWDNTSRLWDVQTGMELQRLEHEGPVGKVTFSQDGRKVATASNVTAGIWDVQTGKNLQKLDHDEFILRIAFSPDGSRIATDTTYPFFRFGVVLWNVKTGERLKEFEIPVNRMAFSQDGMLAMACIDNTARLFDVKTYKETERLEHDGSVYEVAFSSDGSKLVTASSDNTAHLWDVRTGEELQRIELEVLANKFAFSQDGREAAAVSDDGSVLIQTFNISVLMDDACSRVSQNMTRSEWNRSIGNQDCLTCPAEGSFDQSSIWPWGRRECQPCGGHLG